MSAVTDFLVFPLLHSADAVVAETKTGQTLEQLATHARANKEYIGFSSDGRMYRFVGARSTFVVHASDLYYKTGAKRDEYVAVSFMNCNNSNSCPSTVVTYPNAATADALSPTQTNSTTGIGYTGDINTLFNGAWFLLRVKRQTAHAPNVRYTRFLSAFNNGPNPPGCLIGSAPDLQGDRKEATPFMFRNNQIVITPSTDLAASGVWKYNTANNLIVADSATIHNTPVLGNSKFNVGWQTNGRLKIDPQYAGATPVVGISYGDVCSLTMLYANAGTTNVSFPCAEIWWEMIVPSDEWMRRDYVKNGPGRSICCAAPSTLATNVQSLCTALAPCNGTSTASSTDTASAIGTEVYIGAGVGAALLIGVLIYIMYRKNNSTPPK